MTAAPLPPPHAPVMIDHMAETQTAKDSQLLAAARRIDAWIDAGGRFTPFIEHMLILGANDDAADYEQ